MQPNMSEQPTQKGPDNDEPPRPTRAQRLAAFGFLGAFGLTILTVLLTGLRVGAPAAGHVLHPAPPAAASGASSTQAGAPSGSARPGQSVPAEPPTSVGERRKNEDAAREDSARDPDDRTRKDSAVDADDSRAHDAR
jgi:hypothetical protein